jgi:broad specificity phosphatase PhoE
MIAGMKKTTSGLKRRPFLTPVWLAAFAAAVLFSFAIWLWGTADSTTVVVIRHAEKDSGIAADPPLSAAGEARAALLARIFGNAESPGRISAIYVSPTLRSRLTAAPLAARLGLTPVALPADDPRGLARRALHEHEGTRILIVGHADTIPKIVAALSGEKDIPAIGDQEYGTMYIVTVPRLGRANLLRLSY